MSLLKTGSSPSQHLIYHHHTLIYLPYIQHPCIHLSTRQLGAPQGRAVLCGSHPQSLEHRSSSTQNQVTVKGPMISEHQPKANTMQPGAQGDPRLCKRHMLKKSLHWRTHHPAALPQPSGFNTHASSSDHSSHYDDCPEAQCKTQQHPLIFIPPHPCFKGLFVLSL